MNKYSILKSLCFFSIVVLVLFYGQKQYNTNSSYNSVYENSSKTHALCIVLTSEKTITTRGVAVWETWGKYCNKTIFSCNCKNVKKYNELIAAKEEIPDSLKNISLVANYPILYINVEEDYNKMVFIVYPIIPFNLHLTCF